MGRDVSIVRSDGVREAIASVSYVRPNDSKVWKYRCRVSDQKVVWGTIDAFGPSSGFGPWRDRPGDEVITYRLDRGGVAITQEFSAKERTTKRVIVD
jgi:hypothetical protein